MKKSLNQNQRDLLNKHHLKHIWYSSLIAGRELHNSDGSLMTLRQIADDHQRIVENMLKDQIVHYFIKDDLDKTLPNPLERRSMIKDFFKLPRDLMLVKNFIGLEIDGQHRDVLIRSKFQNGNFSVSQEGITLPLRKALDPEEKDNLSWIYSPKIHNLETISLYDLVLRKKNPVLPILMKDLVKLDLGCGNNKSDGFIGIDKEFSNSVDVLWDLEDGIPFANDSVSEIRAYNILEYLPNPDGIIQEICRVLIKDGKCDFKIGSGKKVKSVWPATIFNLWKDSLFTLDVLKSDFDSSSGTFHVNKYTENIPPIKPEVQKENSSFWEDNWYKIYPKDGKGKFQLQYHFRGLDEEETKLPILDLLKTNHSVHIDLIFCEGFGWTIFLAGDNRKVDILKPDNKLRCLPKAAEMSSAEIVIARPGESKASKNKWGKVFTVDSGSYWMGMWREHVAEFFLQGSKIPARIMFQYAPIEKERGWLISIPKDQTPYIDSHSKAETVRELRGKGQKYLIWTKLDMKPEFVYTTNRVLRKDKLKQIVYCVAMSPNEPDIDGEYCSKEDIEEAAHSYLVNSRKTKLSHTQNLDAEIVESYIAPINMEINNELIKSGSWIAGMHIKRIEDWKKVEDGEIVGFSVGGTKQFYV